MATIFVTWGGRGQYERLILDHHNRYRLRRFHVDQPIGEVIDCLLKEARELDDPPIVCDPTVPEAGKVVNALEAIRYPRLARSVDA